jgi:hypothetical protein
VQIINPIKKIETLFSSSKIKNKKKILNTIIEKDNINLKYNEEYNNLKLLLEITMLRTLAENI